ncbi:quinone oxidoreductase family protein [Penaeicola halotolerans]|uniref:quinone oxidoreductase family protein n=1 Tax=Penaeicola halotolerans TaxID=2793196 RepID=UPI001CF87D2A|nr:zinc-binding dehydrogenase [Penaeicola halotolerans]
MKAIILTDQNEDKLDFVTLPKPSPATGEVLIKIKAAALNHRDQWCREGLYPSIKYGTVLGSDGAGVVEELGDAVSEKLLGQEVLINPNIGWGELPNVQHKDFKILGMPDHGTLAEYIVVKADRVHLKPSHLSFEEAAALPLGGLTAYHACFYHAQIKAGEKVLITGVGGGVAQFAMQFAVAAGAEVYVTSGAVDKISQAKTFGALEGFNYKESEWQKAALKTTGGFDKIIDSAGGKMLNTLLDIVKPGGKIIFYGATLGNVEQLNLRKIFWNQITLQGSTMGSDQDFEDMIAFVSKHKIHPMISSLRPLAQALEAFEEMKAGKQTGKLVLCP